MLPTHLDVKLLDERAVAPTRTRDADAAYDLRCLDGVKLAAGERAAVATGVALALPAGVAGLIRPRSGLALRYGLDVLGGLIDPGYRGDITVIVLNTGSEPFAAEAGERIAQLLLVPFWAPQVNVRDELPDEGGRGAAGFGSSGRR
jgi:dUTP pyrophosphatase